MKYQQLGASGLWVSPICLGTMTYGSPVSEQDAIHLTHQAIDLGINFIDTANAYEGYNRVSGSAGGVAEKILGKALKGRRDHVVLATKVGSPLGPRPQDRGLTATTILRHLDDSLSRLQTDHIDLYIIHWPDKHCPMETTLRALDVAIRQGKIRYFGASNHSAAQLCELLWLADKGLGPRVVSSQIPYSMLLRHFEHDLPWCAQKQIAITPYQSLQGGLLTGKYQRHQDVPANSRAAEKPAWVWQRDDQLYDTLEAIAALAEEAAIPMAQYTLAWTLSRPGMCSLVVGAKRIEQVQDAIAASNHNIPIEHLDRIDTLLPSPWKQIDPLHNS